MGQRELDNLVRIGQLKAEPGVQLEIDGLIRSGTVRLRDAAALRWHGYRSENRYVVFQCLQHTLGIAAEQWRVLDQAHRKRNLAEYEGDVEIDDALLAALLRVAAEVSRRAQQLGRLGGVGT